MAELSFEENLIYFCVYGVFISQISHAVHFGIQGTLSVSEQCTQQFRCDCVTGTDITARGTAAPVSHAEGLNLTL